MTLVTAPTFSIREIDWFLDQPAQVNRGTYSGSRQVVSNPWHAKWRASVTLKTEQGEANIRATRAFLTSLRGQVGTFLLPATEGAQVSLSSAAPLDLNFAAGTYTASGTSYALTALPGYSYTRSGAVEFYNGSNLTNTIDTFAANVAPVVSNGTGFEAYETTTNSLLNSQQATLWGTASNGTVTADNTTAPDGTTTADLFTRNATVGQHYIPIAAMSFTSAKAYTYSVFLKAGTNQFAQLAFGSAAFGPSVFVNFDLTNGLVGTASGAVGRIINCGNGWFRCIATATATATASTSCWVAFVDSATAGQLPSGAGNSATAWVWQAQMLLGSFSDGGPIIVTTASSASIGTGALSVSCPNGSYTATYTFSDGSTQAIPTTISGGVFTMPTYPTTLNLPTVKEVSLAGPPSATTATASAAQGATSITLSTSPAMTKGMLATVTLPSGNRQMVMLTADISGSTITFLPPLREAISSGASVEVTNPTCQVALVNSEYGWTVAPWRRYGIQFDVEEAF